MPKFKEGDIVWARLRGYPWWPAVLSKCPALMNGGLWFIEKGKKIKYHCIFLAWKKERAWVDEGSVREFSQDDIGNDRKKEYKVNHKDFRISHSQALELASDILNDPHNPYKYLVKESTDLNLNTAVGSETPDNNNDVLSGKKKIDINKKQASSKPKAKKISIMEVTSKKLINISPTSSTKGGGRKGSKNKKTNVRSLTQEVIAPGKFGKIKKYHQKSLLVSPVCHCTVCKMPDCGQCECCLKNNRNGNSTIGEKKLKCMLKKCTHESNVVDDNKTRKEAHNKSSIDVKNVKVGNQENIDYESDDSEGDGLYSRLVINFDEEPESKEATDTTERKELSDAEDAVLNFSKEISYEEEDLGLNDSMWKNINESLMNVESSLSKGKTSIKTEVEKTGINAIMKEGDDVYGLSPRSSSGSSITLSNTSGSNEDANSNDNDSDSPKVSRLVKSVYRNKEFLDDCTKPDSLKDVIDEDEGDNTPRPKVRKLTEGEV